MSLCPSPGCSGRRAFTTENGPNGDSAFISSCITHTQAHANTHHKQTKVRQPLPGENDGYINERQLRTVTGSSLTLRTTTDLSTRDPRAS